MVKQFFGVLYTLHFITFTFNFMATENVTERIAVTYKLLDPIYSTNIMCSSHATTIVMDIISQQRTSIKNLIILPTRNIYRDLSDFDEFLTMLTTRTSKGLKVFPIRSFTHDDRNSTKEEQTFDEGENNDNAQNHLPNETYKEDYNYSFLHSKEINSDIESLGTESLLLFLHDSRRMEHLGEIMAMKPNLIKILFVYGPYWCNGKQSLIIQNLLNFMENQFKVRRDLFLYIIPLCTRNEDFAHGCFIDRGFVYNAFVNQDGTWGRPEVLQLKDKRYCTVPIDQNFQNSSTTVTTVTDCIQNLKKKLPMMNGYPLNIVFFSTAMAFFKANSTILRKKLSHAALQYPFNNTDAYFGLDIEVLKELSRQLNFTPLIAPSSDSMDYGWMEPNGSFNGALGDVLYKRADFIMNGLFIKDYGTQQLEFSTTVDNDKLCIVVRTADLIPDSLLMTKCFDPIVWLTLIVTLLLVGFGYYGLTEISSRVIKIPVQKRQLTFTESPNLRNSTRESWNEILNFKAASRIVGLLLSAPVTGVGSSSHERIFVTVCLLWSLNLTGAFQGSLVDVYTNSISYHNMDTLAELDESGIPISVLHAGLITDVFGSEPPGTRLGNLHSKMFVATHDNNIILSRIATKGDMAALQRLVDMPKIFQQFVRSDGQPLIHVIKECPRSYRLAYLFPKSSVFLEAASQYISLFAQSGLIRKWYDDTMYIFTLEGGNMNRLFIRSHAVILTLSHLQTAFYVLAMGLSISVFIFLLEITFSNKPKSI